MAAAADRLTDEGSESVSPEPASTGAAPCERDVPPAGTPWAGRDWRGAFPLLQNSRSRPRGCEAAGASAQVKEAAPGRAFLPVRSALREGARMRRPGEMQLRVLHPEWEQDGPSHCRAEMETISSAGVYSP